MALQIRRGTNAERQLITPLQGEIIFTTDTKKLYVGDGTTLGGIEVDTGGGGGSDTNTTYSISAETVSGGANLTLTGNDSSIDSVKLAEGANVTITRTDANTITIASTLGLDGGILSVSEDTSPELGGDLTLSGFNITGTGDIDIFGDIILSGLSSLTTPILYSDKIVTGNTSEGLKVNAAQYYDAAFQYHKGTNEAPTAIIPGEYIGSLQIRGYNGTAYQFSGGLLAQFEAGANLTDQYPKSTLSILTGGGGDVATMATLTSGGVFSAPVIKPGVYADAAARDVAIPTPAAGMMVFVTDVTQFQGYNGTAWVALN